MKTTTIKNLKGLTLREIFENSLFRRVQFESIFNHGESILNCSSFLYDYSLKV